MAEIASELVLLLFKFVLGLSIFYFGMTSLTDFLDRRNPGNSLVWLKVHRLVVGLFIVFFILLVSRPPDFPENPWPSMVQIYSATEPKGEEVFRLRWQMPLAENVFAISPQFSVGPLVDIFQSMAGLLAVIYLLGLIGRSYQLIREIRQMNWIRRHSYLYRQVSGLQIWISPHWVSPFSLFWCWRLNHKAQWGSQIFISTEFLLNRAQLKQVLAHELQHLRQRDTIWAWALQLFNFVFWFHPLVHRWVKHIKELQEFACDEAIITRRPSARFTYGQTLLAIINNPRRIVSSPLGTPGLITSSQLSRRIHRMALFQVQKKLRASLTIVFAAVLALSVSSFAVTNLFEDQRMTLKKGRQLIAQIQPRSGIELVMNQDVLDWLNRATGTERSRVYMRNSLKRMKIYQPQIEAQLRAANLPWELLAVPLHESGYQNIDGRIATGLWQFIPQTARAFGLRVDDQVDDRMNPQLLTGAAVKYYTKLYRDFQNWSSALLAYNMGEKNLQDLFEKLQTQDPWKLDFPAGWSSENRNYLPRVMASIIILHHPDLVSENKFAVK